MIDAGRPLLEQVTVGTSPLCRYLVGRAGADFLVQCGLRHPHSHLTLYGEDAVYSRGPGQPLEFVSEASDVLFGIRRSGEVM